MTLVISRSSSKPLWRVANNICPNICSKGNEYKFGRKDISPNTLWRDIASHLEQK